MSTVTALAEVIGLMQNAGVEPDKIIAFSGLVHDKPDLAAWLNRPRHERDRHLAERGAAPVMNNGKFMQGRY